MQYAKIENNMLKYPSYDEFIGIPNWQQHDSALRRKGYLPVTNMPEGQDGKKLVIDTFEQITASTTVIEPRWTQNAQVEGQEDQEQTFSWQDTPITKDTSYIEVRTYHYDDIAPVVPAVTLEDYNTALEAHLRNVRNERGYTERDPSEYYNSTVARWAQDARDWIAYRDQVMLYGLEKMNEYSRTGEAPCTLEEFRQGLEAIEIEWTYTEEVEEQ